MFLLKQKNSEYNKFLPRLKLPKIKKREDFIMSKSSLISINNILKNSKPKLQQIYRRDYEECFQLDKKFANPKNADFSSKNLVYSLDVDNILKNDGNSKFGDPFKSMESNRMKTSTPIKAKIKIKTQNTEPNQYQLPSLNVPLRSTYRPRHVLNDKRFIDLVLSLKDSSEI